MLTKKGNNNPVINSISLKLISGGSGAVGLEKDSKSSKWGGGVY